MQRYSNFRPTEFDIKGLNLPDRQDWLVCPISRNRDSDTLQESNFSIVERLLGEYDPASDDHEIHRFNHWANGWFEIILVRPNSACATKATLIENELADHPILDESDYSERELDN